MTPHYHAYLAPARATNQIWRLVLGVMLITGIYVAWMVGMGAVMWLAAGLAGFERQLARIGGGSDPWSLILLLSTFLGAWAGTAITLRVLHRRRLRSLFGRPPVVLRDFVLGVAMMAAIGGGLGLILAPFMPGLERATPPGVWLSFLPLALLGILIQTGAEELVFRGYIQGQLAARFRSPLVWLTVPTILFGLAHYAPEDSGANVWIVVAATGLFGLVASDLTARTGSLGLAWGLHFANNVLAILVISVTGGLDGLALLHLPAAAASDAVLRPLLLSDMALMALVWLGCRLWLRRR
ncbi:MAG: CPBP family intramembrane metalloprotease [Rhodobacteraceae bacterium]|jgi:hypothetical protein|nr:CPBP family intramembrane metalloprotease [Paracoccaceae bacterium]